MLKLICVRDFLFASRPRSLAVLFLYLRQFYHAVGPKYSSDWAVMSLGRQVTVTN